MKNCCKFLLCALIFLLNACTSDVTLFGRTLWGRSYNGERPTIVRVKKGDTLYSIAKYHEVPIREIIEINNFTPPYTLIAGQVVKLPKAKYHIVEKGDTVYNIARKYNVDRSTLSRTNNLSAPYTLIIGQKLLIPGSIVTNTSYAQTYNEPTSEVTPAKTTKIYRSSYQKDYISTKPQKNRKNKFIWPVNGQIISNYGPIAKGRNNDGINIKAPKGTPVKAADDGIVAYAGNELKGFGNLILIKHYDGWVTAYAHTESMSVKKGQKILKGDTIAKVGTSGGVSTPQLHFETRAGKKAYDPKVYLR